MRFSMLTLGFACGLFFLLANAGSRADFKTTFDWNQSQGPPVQMNAACAASPACVLGGCTNVNGVPMKADEGGSGNTVVVNSYDLFRPDSYGTCQENISGNCLAYPGPYGVRCATVWIYGFANCMTGAGKKYVYAGTCSF